MSAFKDPDLPFADARSLPDADYVPDEVLDAYELPAPDVAPLHTGSYNLHFRVETNGGTFDLRRSNRPTSPENLVYEASLLGNLERKGFDLCPRIFRARDGRANVWHEGVGWTLFPWMGDGPKLVRQELTPVRWAESARVLAHLHTAGADFQPEGRRGDWPVYAGPEDWGRRWLPRAESLARELGAEENGLWELARRSAAELVAIDFSKLPTTICHADYRMANLRFEGDRLAVVFDFDVAFQTTRLLDIGRLVAGFERGQPEVDVVGGSQALRAYDQESPLTPAEWNALPALIRWRLLRDAVITYDRWWVTLGACCHALIDGAAEEIVERARWGGTSSES